MPRLRIKGYGEVEISNTSASSISKMIENKEPGMTWVKAGVWSGRLSDVTGVIHTKEKNLDGDNKHQEDLFFKIKEERKSILSQPPKQRSKNTNLFKLYYKAIFGKDVEQDKVSEIESLQEQYYNKYPQKCHTNYVLFNKVIFPDGNIPKNQKLSPIQMGVLNLIGNVFNQDVINSKYGN